MLDSLGGLLSDGRTGSLIVLLAAAAVLDYRTLRIPNALVVCGALFGVIYNSVLPPFPDSTIFFPLSGLVAGLLLFLPLYLVRAIGAGDVKLLAMVGSFLGPVATFYSALASMIVAGVLSIALVMVRGTTMRMFQNLASLLRVGAFGALAGSASGRRITPSASAATLPYGVAIAIGTVGYLVSHQLRLL